MNSRVAMVVMAFVALTVLSVPSAQAGALDPSNLLGYWDFNDNSNPAVAPDVSGNAPNGNLLNGAAYTGDGGGFSGLPGDRAMNFGTAGTNATVHVPGGAFLEPAVDSQAISFAFWQYRDPSTPLGNESSFWAVSPTASGNRGAQAHVPWSNTDVYFDHAGCCGAETRISRDAAADATHGWHHYAFVLGADNTKEIWIDGNMFHSGGGSGGTSTSTASLLPFSELYISSERGSFNAYRGLIDDFAVTDTKLRRYQIEALAGGTSPADLPGVTPGSHVNLAYLAGSASQSSEGWGGVANRAIDGNTDGNFGNGSVSHTNQPSDSWWQVELDGLYYLDEITLYNRSDCCGDRLSNLHVSVLAEDGITEVWGVDFAGPVPQGGSQTFLLPDDTIGQCVKVQIDGGLLSLAEVEVIGSPLPEPCTLVLLGLGGAGLLGYVRRKRK